MLRIISIVEDTMVDGPGFRTSIYCAGCHHACPECHNPQTWDPLTGHDMTEAELMAVIKADPYANVTFTGGDPMYQAEAFASLARAIKRETGKNIWCFTGFSFEELLHMPAQRELLQTIDVLVDGPYIKALRDEDLLFRGSANQRLIDVPATLKAGKVVLWQDSTAVEKV